MNFSLGTNGPESSATSQHLPIPSDGDRMRSKYPNVYGEHRPSPLAMRQNPTTTSGPSRLRDSVKFVATLSSRASGCCKATAVPTSCRGLVTDECTFQGAAISWV